MIILIIKTIIFKMNKNNSKFNNKKGYYQLLLTNMKFYLKDLNHMI